MRPEDQEQIDLTPEHVKAGVNCGQYFVETRLLASERAEDLLWTSCDVTRVQIVSDGQRVAVGRHYFPWQAEDEARLLMHPELGAPEVAEGIRQVRVRCDKPCSGIPMGPFSMRVPHTAYRGGPGGYGYPEAQTDGRLWRYQAEPDQEGTAEFSYACEQTGRELHPVFSQRRFDPNAEGIDLDHRPTAGAAKKPAKRKRGKKAKAPEAVVPKGAMF